MDGLSWQKYIIIACVYGAVFFLLAQHRPTGPGWLSSLIALARSGWERIRSLKATRNSWKQLPPEWWSALAGAIAGGLFSSRSSMWLLGSSLVLGAGLGSLFPKCWKWFQSQQRQQAMEREFPEALELLANGLRAGLSLAQAFEVVGHEAPQPIALEFQTLVRQQRLGLAAEQVLEKWLQRWPNRDLELFVVAASVSQRTGSNLAEGVSRLIGTVRERFRLRGKIDTTTSQARLSGWVVGLMPPVLLVGMSLLDPELMTGFFRHPLGWLMLGAGVVMELLGLFFIGKILKIEV